MPSLLAIVAVAGVVLVVAFSSIADGNMQLNVALGTRGLVVAELVVVQMTTYRVHH